MPADRPLPAIRLLQVPSDSGHRDTRMGAGPTALAAAGAAGRLRGAGHAGTEQVLSPSAGWTAEVGTAFELQRLVAESVASARTSGEVPQRMAGDFNTPEEDPAGSSTVTARPWSSAARRRRASRASGPARGRRRPRRRAGPDRDAGQVLERSALTWLHPAQARDPGAVAAAIDALAARVDVLHFHVDLDVHDPSIAPANGYAAPDGLSAEDVRQVLRLAAERIPVVSGAPASYDPSYDVDGRMPDTGLALLGALADAATPD